MVFWLQDSVSLKSSWRGQDHTLVLMGQVDIDRADFQLTHILMTYSERTTLGIWLPYPWLCSWLLSTAHHPVLWACSHLGTLLSPASHQFLSHWDLMFGWGGKEALICGEKAVTQLYLHLLAILPKLPDSLAPDFCHMSNGGNIR